MGGRQNFADLQPNLRIEPKVILRRSVLSLGPTAMMEWLNWLGTIALQATSHLAPQVVGGLFLVALFTELGVPFPGVMDGVLFLIGYDLGRHWLPALVVPLALMAGRQSGAGLVFWAARSISAPIKKRLGSRFSLEALRQDIANNHGGGRRAVFALLARLGAQLSRTSGLNLAASPASAIALGRVTPGLLTACSVACGVLGVNYYYFVAGVAISSLLADLALIAIGLTAGTLLPFFGVTVPIFWMVVIGIALNILLIYFLGRWLLRRQRNRAAR